MFRIRTSIFFALFLPVYSAASNAVQEVRIALGAPLANVTLTGAELNAVGAQGQVSAIGKKLELKAGKSGIEINGKSTESDFVYVKSTGNIRMDKRDYRNTIEVNQQTDAIATKLNIVHPLPLEAYIVGIVSSEVGSNWPPEALKAQAIAARTYAIWQKYRRLDKSYHMESSVIDQVYGGTQKEHALAEKAVQETYGQVMTFQGKPIQAYFHSNCGSHTEGALDAWGTQLDYLPGNSCGFCHTSPKYKWDYKVSRTNLSQLFRFTLGGEVEDIEMRTKTQTGRAKTIDLIGKRGLRKTISAASFRETLGYNNLRSTLIDRISIGRHEAHFSGRGFGHGVGMCQWGAMGMAKAGSTAEQILERYYPGTEIRRLY